MKIKRKYIRFGVIAIVLVFAAALYCGMEIYRYAFGKEVAKSTIIHIPSQNKNLTFGEIFPDSVFKNFHYAEKMWGHYNPNGTVRGGYYTLREGMSLRQLFNMVRAGLQTPVKVVLNPVRTMDRLAGMVSKFVEIDSASLLETLSDSKVAEHYGFTPETFITSAVHNLLSLYEQFITPHTKQSQGPCELVLLVRVE